MHSQEEAGDIAGSVVAEPGIRERIAARHGVPAGAPLRLAFVAGPGDVVGSYDHWRQGRHDPRVPVMAYSTQFYVLAEMLGAEALVLTEQAAQPQTPHPRIRLQHVPRNRAARRLGWHLAQHAYALRVARALARYRPHVVIVGPDMPAWFYRALPRGCRLIVTMHNTFWPMGRRPRHLRARLRQGMLRGGLRRMAGAVCTSQECAAQLTALTGRQSGLHVETPQIPAHYTTADVQPRAIARNLLYLGRIEADKGVFDLLEAFGALAGRFPDARLTFAGAGSAAGALAEAIASHPARARIRFPGLLPGNAVHAALRESDLLICPTRSAFHEGLALVVIEAAVQGVPSLASSVVPAAAMLPRACVTFPADDTGALTAALARLMEDAQAFAACAAATQDYRWRFRDRSLSWGSCLARALAGDPPPG